MPSSTAKGFPYPVGSDKLGDTDLRIKALADYLNDNVGMVKSGSGSSGTLAAGAGIDVTVNFSGTAFPGVPQVVATVKVNTTLSTLVVFVKTVTASTVVFRCQNNHSGSVNIAFDWIARY